MKRFVVHVAVGWNFRQNGETSYEYEPHFFDNCKVAEAFRSDMLELNAEVSKVMDLDEIDFD